MRVSATEVLPLRRARRTASQLPDRGHASQPSSQHEAVLGLQRAAGNRAVQRLLQDGVPHGVPVASLPANLRMAGAQAAHAGSGERRRPVQVLQDPTDSPAQSIELRTSGPGEALPITVRNQMEHALDADFSRVRVHPNDAQVSAVGAQAFTAGEDIHFATDRYNPSTEGGREMIGHELTHVLQQREGRAVGSVGDGNAEIVRDAALEHEADQRGHRASTTEGGPVRATTAGEPGRVAPGKPVVQGWAVPAALKAMGAAFTAAGIADKAAIAGAVIAGVSTTAQVGAAIAPGSTGVQSYNLETWNTGLDRLRLEQIIQFRLINAHVEHWIKTHPNEPVTTTSEDKTSTTSTTTETVPTKKGGSISTATGSSTTKADAGPNAPESAIDQTVRAAVGRQVEMDVLTKLNENQTTIQGRQYIWSDSGDHTADTFGTVGAIRFRDVVGAIIYEPLALSPEAAQIPNLVVPGSGSVADYRQFRGASLERGEDMETGMNDDLGINLVGGGVKKDEAANDGHGKVVFTTEWNWDDNSTHMDLGLTIGPTGVPNFTDPTWRGEPED